MEAAIERLRVSKEQFFKDEFERGRKRGRYRAREHANYGELLQLAELDIDYLECYRYNKDGTIQVICETVEIGDLSKKSDFASKVFGADAPTTAELWIGWVEGAQEAFSKVKDQL